MKTRRILWCLCCLAVVCLCLPTGGVGETAELRIDEIVPLEGDAFGEMGDLGLFQKAEALTLSQATDGEAIPYDELWMQMGDAEAYPVGIIGFFEIPVQEGEDPGFFFFPMNAQDVNVWVVALDSRHPYAYTLEGGSLTLLADGPAQAYRPDDSGQAYAFNLSVGSLVTMEDYQ